MADGVDQALDQEGGFRAAGAAIGVDRDGVGEDGLHFDVDPLEFLDRRIRLRRSARKEGHQRSQPETHLTNTVFKAHAQTPYLNGKRINCHARLKRPRRTRPTRGQTDGEGPADFGLSMRAPREAARIEQTSASSRRDNLVVTLAPVCC